MRRQDLKTKNLMTLILILGVSFTVFSFNAEAITIPYSQGEHPRIYIESSDLPQIAARCSQAGQIKDLYVEMKNQIDSESGNPTNLSRYKIGSALTYLIETELGNSEEAARFLGYAKNDAGTDALVYDWIYNGLTSGERTTFGNSLFADMVDYETYNDGHYYLRDWHHTYVDGGSAVMYLDFLYEIIALSGEGINDSEVQRYLNEYENWFRNILLPFIDLEGAVDPEGGYNSPHYIAQQVEAWDCALNEDNWTGNIFLEEKCLANLMMKKPFNNYCPFVAVDCFLSRLAWPNVYLQQLAPLYEKNNNNGYAQLIANYAIDNPAWSFEIYTPWRILWYDPSKSPVDLNTLPKAKYFDGNPSGLGYGIAVFRTGFDEDDTLIVFKCGDSFCPAKSFNGLLNHFAIYHRGDLAKIDGSDGHYYGGGYLSTFMRQTIGGNAMTVSDPDNPVGEGLSQWSSHYNDPYYIFYYDQSICNAPGPDGFVFGAPHFTGTAIGDHYEGAESDTGDIIRFESDAEYSYLTGDASDAFYDPVCTLFQRELAFLNEKYLIVLDRVTSGQADFIKRWYLHTVNEPVMSGTKVGDTSSTDGATEWDGSLAYADCDYAGGTMGRLYVKKLLPSGNFRKRGGEGFEYWCDGLNYDPDPGNPPMPEEHEGRPGWRLEQDAQTQQSDVFLNVLYPTDAGAGSFPNTILITSTDGLMQGALIEDSTTPFVAMFSKNESLKNSLTYDASYSGTGKHFIANMESGSYDIYKDTNKILSYVAVSSANVLFFESTGGGTFQIQAAGAPQPPGQASNPSPADSATDVSVDADLSWSSGTGSTSSDVYFGTDSTPDAGEFKGNQTATTYEPGTMSNSTTYYWRIDEVNAQGTTTGNVWSFTTEAAAPPPGQASNPSPADSATDVSIIADLSWTAGSNTTSHDVYFGTSSPGTFQGNQTATTYDAGTMAESTTYYWRIDELNAVGTTTGNVWSFTTGTAPPAFLQDGGTDGIVSMEAENYDVYTQQGAHDWISVTTPTGYTGSAAMNTTPNNGTNQNTGYAANSPRLDFQVDFVKTGTHYVWIRGYGATGSDDSIHAGLDGAEISTCDRISTFTTSYTWSKATMDGPDATFDVASTGIHTVNAWMREDGFVFDKIVLTTNASYTPTGDGPAESPRGAQPPGQASTPSPADSATDINIDADLSWTAGSNATSHDVYFGTDSTPDAGEFQGNQTDTTFEPGTLSYDITYYWRIDEINAGGTTTGNIWSFTTEAAPTPPGQATNPDPADTATDVSIAADLSWTAGTNSTSSDVYFGTSSPGTFQGNQTATTFDPGTLDYDTTYYWRINEINAGGTTTGNVWSFTTATAPTYECDNWQSLHPEWIFCDDFENTDPMVGQGRYFEYWDDEGDFVPVPGVGVDNSKGMRVIWQSGETGAGGMKLAFGRNPSGFMDKGIRNTEDFPEVYYRLYLKMQDGWQGNPDKLSRATAIAASDWSQAMIAHHWGSGLYYLAVDPASCVDDANSQVMCVGYNDFAHLEWLGSQAGTTPIFDSDNDDIWHYIEMHVKLNDPGQANGIQEFWIDGSLDARRDNLDFVSSYTDYAINAIFIENSWDAGSPQLQERYIDSFVVSTQPIGEWTPGPQPPGQASNPSPADTATDVAVDADLSWTAGTDSTSSDVYFGTTSPGTFQGNQTATTFDPGTMANDTTYYWRIDEINAEGTTTGNVWSFTTIVAAPGQASSPSPADSAANVAVDTDLSWTTGSGATSHDVYFGTSSPGAFQGNQTATTFDTGSMANDTTYYWRIDEVNAADTTTGAVWSFTTIVALPAQASSPSPGTGASDIAVDNDLSWTAGSGTTSHDVYFGTSSPGSYQGNQTATTFDTGSMSNDTTYYWRIDEVNAAGTTTGTVWNFTTIVAAPGPATSPSPGNGATDVAVNADLSWTAGSGATSHDVYFGTSSPGSYQGNQAATTFDTGTMANDTTYYWRIDEVNAGGTTTGAVWSFTTIVAAPGQASSPSPVNGATDVDINANLSWTAGSGATSHDVYFGTSSPGSYQGNQAATTFDPGTMANDTTYYWRIDEVNTGGTTTGVVWSFTTIVAAPGQASSPSPANTATDVDVDTDLGWTAGSGATSHDVYFGTSSPGTFQGNQAATSFDPGTMAYDTTYYWRIDEINVGGTTAGTVWNFTTESAPLPPPGQASNPNPADSATDVGVGADLSWTAGSDATSRDVYFGTSSPGTFQGNQTVVTFDPGTMDNDTTYYWRIDEINASGTTSGVVWSFTTVESGGQVIEEFGDATNTDHPGTIEDTFTNVGEGGSVNYSTDVTLNTYTWPADVIANTTIIKWDLSSIPTDATVIDATLYLYQVETGGDTSYDLPVHKVINVNPVISACTWNTYDGTNSWTGGADGGQSDVAAAEDLQVVDATNNEYKTWSMTNMVQDWVTTPSSNYGMLINSDPVATIDSHRSFASTEVVDASTRPKLIVTYSAGVAPPGQASSPSPADSAANVAVDTDLSWTTGTGADSHDVYFGTTSPGTFQGNQTATTFDTGSMANDTTYYWRIDEVNTAGTTTGAVWSFTTIVAAPGQASNPSPADSATDVSIDVDLSWTAGSGATSSDVYFGTTSPGTFQGNQTATTFEPGTMAYDTIYYWRIDEINAGGTTAGAVWSFTTEAAPPPLPGQAANPSPADSATDVAVSADLSWTAGSDATSHDVYFGTTSPGTFQGNQTAVTFDPGIMANDTTYYWRIDEINSTGTTTGTVWSFTTIVSAGDEIIGWWEMNDAAGGTTVDSSAYGNDGTLVGPPTWTDDAERGWCLDFSDANNYVTIPNESFFDITGDITVMAWMKDDYIDWRNFSTIIAKGKDDGGGWALQKASRANAMSFYVDVAGMPWDGIKAGVGIFDNQWHHVAGVYDGSNAYIYIDGGLDSNSVACSGNMATNNWDVYIGENSQTLDGGSNAREWNGLMDDVRVYNYALSQSEVNDIYTGGPTPPGQASNPSPADSATDVVVDDDLNWTAGSGSTSSDVYFGTTSPGAFQGNQTATTFDPGTMSNDTTYYWRIDEINAAGTTTGVVWSFTTVAAPSDVEIIGSWVSGTSHTAVSGTNRLLVFTAHAEDNNADMNITSVTYGGQTMTKVIEENIGNGYRAYAGLFVLDEAGINAASGSSFVVTWAENPNRTPAFTSVFMQNVNQSSPVGASASNGGTTATISTSALSTNDGDMVVLAATCGNTGTYSVNNGFTEAIELTMTSADGVAGYKAATGANETPSVTHSNINRQVIAGLVVQAQ